MYELEYVRRRKRRKRAVIIGGISTVVVSTLSIIAFLGRFVGTFTVSLDTGNVKLALSEKSTFANPSAFLRVNSIASFGEYTYHSIEKFTHEAIDSEDSSVDLGANYKLDGVTVESLNFLKYTFYVKNVGSTVASYKFTLNLVESKPASDGRTLDDTLRVMIYENIASNEHNHTVYGKRLSQPRIVDGNPDYRPPISINEEQAPMAGYEFPGYAEIFQSQTVITSFMVPQIDAGEMRRYTIVTWLEGFRSDPETAPVGATIKLGVEINAYEI